MATLFQRNASVTVAISSAETTLLADPGSGLQYAIGNVSIANLGADDVPYAVAIAGDAGVFPILAGIVQGRPPDGAPGFFRPDPMRDFLNPGWELRAICYGSDTPNLTVVVNYSVYTVSA